MNPAAQHASSVPNRTEFAGIDVESVPAGAINCIDHRRRQLWVERDCDQVPAASAFDRVRHGPAGRCGSANR
jgi:hypothetical protein